MIKFLRVLGDVIERNRPKLVNFLENNKNNNANANNNTYIIKINSNYNRFAAIDLDYKLYTWG